MLKKIEKNGKIIALLFKRDELDISDGINFFTSPENNLQVGILKHPQGHVIKPHIHNKIEKIISDRQEMLYIEKGIMKVSFFDETGNKISEEMLNSGDLVLLISKGHGFEFLEDSRIIYVKQGPYVSKEEDKRIFENDSGL